MQTWLGPGAAGRDELRLRAAGATLPNPFGELDDLQFDCQTAIVTNVQISCQAGQLIWHSALLGPQRNRATFDYRPDSGRIELHFDGIDFDGGRLSMEITLQGGHWQARLQGTGIRPAQLSARLAAAELLPGPLQGGGGLDVTLLLEGTGGRLQQGRLQAGLLSDEFSDATGNLAGDRLALDLEADLTRAADRWGIEVDLKARQGQVYIAPVFVDLDARPLQASARVDWLPNRRRLDIHSLHVRQPQVINLQASGVIDPDRTGLIESLALEIEDGTLPDLYETWLQPWLAGTLLGDLHTGGTLDARLNWRQGELDAAVLELGALSFDDSASRFGLTGVNGRLDWGRDARVRQSALRWEQGHVYSIPLGAAEFHTETAYITAGPVPVTRLRLSEPAHIGVLDGELRLDEFILEHAGGHSRWQVDGILTPVSLRRLTAALGWPEFAGRLSGVIPDVRYADDTLSVGGTLLVRVFDGEVTLRNLRLEQPFSVLPRLQVDAQVNGIDLKTLTRAFSFGRIEGRLDGRVKDLDLESWRPVRFDAAFATPKRDRSRHRISQRAVDNISSIGGGGVKGALSRSVMRLFKDFPYDRLGIRCRLENGICDMGGVAPAGSGYYIVKGRLLPPRLDVIGYADRVDWDSLVSQLVAVTRQQAMRQE